MNLFVLRREQDWLCPSPLLAAEALCKLFAYKKGTSVGMFLFSLKVCGENRIRTCEPLLTVTRFPGVMK